MSTTTTATLLAYHGDPAIKEQYLSRVRAHRAADDIIRGTYGMAKGSASGWRGCAVGCTIHGSDYAAYETELGIPEALAHLEDTLFERMPEDRAIDWPLEFLEAIPVGADLSRVVWQVLERGIRDRLQFATDATRPAMEGVLREVLEPMALGIRPSQDAYGAALVAAIDAASAAFTPHASPVIVYAAKAAAKAAGYAAEPYVADEHVGDAAAFAGDAAADYTSKAFEWSRWMLEFMAAAPVREEATR